MIHFHANGEDISRTAVLLNRLSKTFKMSIIAVEYPGYGIYSYNNDSERRHLKILKDAETVYHYLTRSLKIDRKDVMVSGRSIGSGPAIHLASMFKPCCLILISPLKSLKEVS